MKKRKKSAIILSVVVIVPLLIFCAVSLYLSDTKISGFIGIWGIINLSDKESYVELTDKPLQLLIRQNDANGDFENNYFDNWEDTGHPARGFGTKNSQKYEYSLRSFTSKYYIVTLEKIE